MGNKQSNEDHSKPLTEEKIREISRKTNLDKEDILKWHSEFLVKQCFNSVSKILINRYTVIIKTIFYYREIVRMVNWKKSFS